MWGVGLRTLMGFLRGASLQALVLLTYYRGNSQANCMVA